MFAGSFDLRGASPQVIEEKITRLKAKLSLTQPALEKNIRIQQIEVLSCVKPTSTPTEREALWLQYTSLKQSKRPSLKPTYLSSFPKESLSLICRQLDYEKLQLLKKSPVLYSLMKPHLPIRALKAIENYVNYRVGLLKRMPGCPLNLAKHYTSSTDQIGPYKRTEIITKELIDRNFPVLLETHSDVVKRFPHLSGCFIQFPPYRATQAENWRRFVYYFLLLRPREEVLAYANQGVLEARKLYFESSTLLVPVSTGLFLEDERPFKAKINFEEAHALNNKWALEGDEEARDRLLAGLLSGSDGYKKDIKTAHTYLEKWATEGVASARQRLYMAVLEGNDEYSQDINKARAYLEKWTAEGDKRAKEWMEMFAMRSVPEQLVLLSHCRNFEYNNRDSILGRLLSHRYRDHVRAVELNTQWANQGDRLARLRLYDGLREGKYGYSKDTAKAVAINTTWANEGDPEARARLIEGIWAGEEGYDQDQEKAYQLMQKWGIVTYGF